MKSGIAMRAATVSVIYQHLLHLSPEVRLLWSSALRLLGLTPKISQGKIGLSSGAITNLVATDAQKIYEVGTK
jgi:hypothetical protein